MSITSLLNVAKGALMTHQRAIDVTGHNIANVTTPGYTRQRLAIEAQIPLRTPQGTIGTGVTDDGVFSTRNSFLDASFRREQGVFAHADTLRDLMGRVEDVFGEPSDNGVGAMLDQFFNAFSDLANDPSSLPARTAVQQAGQALVRQVGGVSSRLDDINQSVTDQFRDTVAQINSISSQIGDLNRQIVSAGGPNHTAPDLEDQRAQLIDQLAGFGAVRVLERTDGSVGVVFGDTLLVDGRYAQQLEVRSVSGGLTAGVVGETRTVSPVTGSLAALSELSTQGIPGIRTELDRLVAGVVSTVNTIHRGGTTLGGATNTDFFDPAGTTARTFALAAPIAASAANVVAGTTSAPGDNAVALQLAALRTTPIASLNSSTAGEFYVGLTGSVSSIVRDAEQEASASEVLASGTAARRASETGVSTDEEMIALMLHQQAFSAAARLVTVADDMMQTLLQMV